MVCYRCFRLHCSFWTGFKVLCSSLFDCRSRHPFKERRAGTFEEKWLAEGCGKLLEGAGRTRTLQ